MITHIGLTVLMDLINMPTGDVNQSFLTDGRHQII